MVAKKKTPNQKIYPAVRSVNKITKAPTSKISKSSKSKIVTKTVSPKKTSDFEKAVINRIFKQGFKDIGFTF